LPGGLPFNLATLVATAALARSAAGPADGRPVVFSNAVSRAFTVARADPLIQEAISRAFTVVFSLCKADVNGDGVVDVDDLICVLISWGPCPTPPEGCPCDVNNDREVDVDDLLQVILAWGACPEI
jgi:hypothetical protein